MSKKAFLLFFLVLFLSGCALTRPIQTVTRPIQSVSNHVRSIMKLASLPVTFFVPATAYAKIISEFVK